MQFRCGHPLTFVQISIHTDNGGVKEYLLPLGPSLGSSESSFLVGRVELSMVCENQIVPFCFRDRSYILLPKEDILKRSKRGGTEMFRPCFREKMRCTVLVEELEFTKGIRNLYQL